MTLTAKAPPRKPAWIAGRPKEDGPPIPHVPAYRIHAVEAWMGEHRENRRPLTVAAPLLAIVCALAEQGARLPTRERLAEAVTGDPRKTYSIDAAISTAIGEGEIFERYEVVPGSVARRASACRHRYLDPSDELLAVYRQAAQRRGVERSETPLRE